MKQLTQYVVMLSVLVSTLLGVVRPLEARDLTTERQDVIDLIVDSALMPMSRDQAEDYLKEQEELVTQTKTLKDFKEYRVDGHASTAVSLAIAEYLDHYLAKQAGGEVTAEEVDLKRLQSKTTFSVKSGGAFDVQVQGDDVSVSYEVANLSNFYGKIKPIKPKTVIVKDAFDHQDKPIVVSNEALLDNPNNPDIKLKVSFYYNERGYLSMASHHIMKDAQDIWESQSEIKKN